MENLATPGAVRRVMEAYGFHFRKSWGQNFLIDNNILQKIVQAAAVNPGDFVLEIGPGIGTLTQALAEAGAKVTAIEIDHQLVEILGQTMADYPQVQVIQGDALRMPLLDLLPQNTTCRVVANLPYYITTPLLLRVFEEKLPVVTTVVMVQREVAERIVALPGSKNYGALTVDLAYYADAEIVLTAPRTVFMPAPNVDSCAVRLTSRPFPHPAADVATFTRIVRAAFGQRRKTLRNALKPVSANVDQLLQAADIDGTRRGETLSPAEFGRLSLAASAQG